MNLSCIRALILLAVSVLPLSAFARKPAEKPKTAAVAAASCGSEIQQISFSEKGYPFFVLENNEMKVMIYTPNQKTGYYRGPRFDWSGMIGKVEYRGHSFYADWHTPHDPENPEHGIGPAEEYDMDNPPGFEEAVVGSPFIKIGIGTLTKTADPPKYFFNNRYIILKAGMWTIAAGPQCAEFTQSTADTQSGYGYAYTKRISISANVLTIAHTLKNTGSKPIATEQYCHNFTCIDSQDIDTCYRVLFPFKPTMADDMKKGFEGLAVLDGSQLRVTNALPGGRSLWASFGGLAGTVAENGFTVENTKTKASVSVKGSLPPSKFNFYAVKSAICPEPFVRIETKPGETVLWSTEMKFNILK